MLNELRQAPVCLASNMRTLHRRVQTTRARPNGEHVSGRHIYRAAVLTGALGTHSALQSDSLLAQTRATITATAVVRASTTSLHSLERATLLVSRAVQQPADPPAPMSIRDETGHSTITVLVTTAANSMTSLDHKSHYNRRDSTDTPIVSSIPPPSGDPTALLVIIAYTAN